MAIAGDFSHQAMEDGKVKGKYAVVPLPGTEQGEIAPAFAGGNNLGVLKSTERRSLAVDLVKELAGKKAQSELFDAMGFLPTFTDTRAEAAAEEPFVEPFVQTLDSRRDLRARLPGLGADRLLAGAADDVPGDRQRPEGRRRRFARRGQEDGRRLRERGLTPPRTGRTAPP